MGVINCTPDSFYPGSRFPDPEEAAAQAIAMVEAGADIVDIGGESSRPGSEPVSEQAELARIVPVLEILLGAVEVPVSIDTYKSVVAETALQMGAHIINDISGLRFDAEMVEVAARYGVPVILMHMKGKPKSMQRSPHYGNVVAEVCEFFAERLEFAIERGIRKQQIVLDPGLGFGKRLSDNYELVNNLQEISKLGCAILLGPSRKSFVQKVLGLPAQEAKEGSLALGTAAILKGAQILRVHDVPEMKRAARIADFLVNSSSVCQPV